MSNYVHKDEVQFSARCSKNGAVGQNPLIVFHLERLSFTGQMSQFDMVYP